ncbi:alpha-ketoacid dehydrogenase subunit beta [Oligoflexia bacterium]|nr:alpha-ketoacid dehydrogenase subunit beta [Oligoflexia bacterium]
MREISVKDAIREAMTEEMASDANVFLMGEEVGASGGVYGCSTEMLERFGERRVVDTPIAENGFTGVGIGAALLGLRPIIEFMSFSFSLVAIDQIINTAAKARLMSGGQLNLPIVFRGANGFVNQYGAQHSNSFEHFFAYTPGLKVVCPATPHDMKGLLKSSIRDDDPVIFCESVLTYELTGAVPDEDYTIPLGVADIKREGSDVTLITWSKNVYLALSVASALEQDGVSVEVLDLRSLRPLDKTAIFESVAKTNRAVILQEQHAVASFGAYLGHLISTEIFDELDAPVGLVSSLEAPIPFSKGLEAAVLPSKERCLAEVMKVLEG